MNLEARIKKAKKALWGQRRGEGNGGSAGRGGLSSLGRFDGSCINVVGFDADTGLDVAEIGFSVVIVVMPKKGR